MRKTAISFCLVLTVALLSGTALAQRADPESHLLSTSVGTPTYDRDGHILQMDVQRYNAQGENTGSSLHRYSWKDGKLQASHYETFDSGDLLTSSIGTHWEYPGRNVLRKGLRIFQNGLRELLRTEAERWLKDESAPIITVVTEQYDAEDALVHTRYQVTERDEKGRIATRDVSTIVASGRQTYRMFEQWRHEDGRVSQVHRHRYDESDELFERELEEWFYNDQGRLSSISKTRFDGEDTMTQLVVEEREYNRFKKVRNRTVTFMTPLHVPTRRLTVSATFTDSGALLTQRSIWEIFENE